MGSHSRTPEKKRRKRKINEMENILKKYIAQATNQHKEQKTGLQNNEAFTRNRSNSDTSQTSTTSTTPTTPTGRKSSVDQDNYFHIM